MWHYKYYVFYSILELISYFFERKKSTTEKEKWKDKKKKEREK